MRTDKIRTMFEILKHVSEEEQKENIKNAIKNRYISKEEAEEVMERLENIGIRKDRVRTICITVKNYSDEKREEALNNAINNGYITEKEKQKVLKLLFPYKEAVERVIQERKNKTQYFRLALEYILGNNNAYLLDSNLTEEQREKITETVRKICFKQYDGRERLIIRELIPEFINEERTEEEICNILGISMRGGITEIEDDPR